MFEEEIINNTSEIIQQVFPKFAENLQPLITILKAVGIAFILYIIYLIVMWFYRWRDRKRLKRIEEKLDKIEKKIDNLLNKKQEKNNKKK